MRALAGSPAYAFALPAYRRWGISPRPEDALITGSTGWQRIQQSRGTCSATPTDYTDIPASQHIRLTNLVRQTGVLNTPHGKVAIAIAAEPASGSFDDGRRALDEAATWLTARLAELPAGQCKS